ncbi:MAG: LOG family protein [Chloroflexota bacterium]
MQIGVFGGSQPKPGSPAYEQAHELGKLLATAGFTVLTGGYIGTMEAVSKGAVEAGGHVVGVTCDEIERWRPVSANEWVLEEWRQETLVDRLSALIKASDGFIALPGGPGTLTEIALTWNLMIINSLPRRPLVLVGDGWQSIFNLVFTSLDEYTPQVQREFVLFAADIHSAAQILINNLSAKEVSF